MSSTENSKIKKILSLSSCTQNMLTYGTVSDLNSAAEGRKSVFGLFGK